MQDYRRKEKNKMEIKVLVFNHNIWFNFTDKFLGAFFIVCLFIFTYLITRLMILKHNTNKKNPML